MHLILTNNPSFLGTKKTINILCISKKNWWEKKIEKEAKKKN
jgi:hypothetical protein